MGSSRPALVSEGGQSGRRSGPHSSAARVGIGRGEPKQGAQSALRGVQTGASSEQGRATYVPLATAVAIPDATHSGSPVGARVVPVRPAVSWRR